MRLVGVRFHDGEFDEKERQKRENGRLEKTDEYFEHHKRYGQEVWREEYGDSDDYLARENVAEEPERERYHSHKLADKLDNADRESYRIRERILQKFAAVFPKSDREDARYLDDEKRNDGEYKRHSEIGVGRAQERLELIPAEKADGADAWHEVDHVAHKNEKKDGHKERKETSRHFPTLQCFGNVVVDEPERFLDERLHFPRNHLQARAKNKCKGDENTYHDPARDERVGYGNAQKFPEFFGRYRDMDAAFALFNCLFYSQYKRLFQSHKCPYPNTIY